MDDPGVGEPAEWRQGVARVEHVGPEGGHDQVAVAEAGLGRQPSEGRAQVEGPEQVHACGIDPVSTLTSTLAISTPIVPTTIRWIHCLDCKIARVSTAVIFQRKAKTKASAPMVATSAWATVTQVSMRAWSRMNSWLCITVVASRNGIWIRDLLVFSVGFRGRLETSRPSP